MTDASTTPPDAGAPVTLAETLDRELEGLDRELTEIEMLVGQARTEAGRHEQKRAQAAERLAGLGASTSPADLAEANVQLVTLTRRAAVMETRWMCWRASRRRWSATATGCARPRGRGRLDGGRPGNRCRRSGAGDARSGPTVAPDPAPGVGRVILAAQEDLRRDIARAIHDGPARA